MVSAVSDYGTSSSAEESVSIAMLVTFLALLWAGQWFGKARDWVHSAVGKAPAVTAAPAPAASAPQPPVNDPLAIGGA